MDYFHRIDGQLFAERVALADLAERFGTPAYIYSRATLERHIDVLSSGLAGLPHLLCYAIKANGNLAILDIVKRKGCGFDAVSGGELARAQHIGARPDKTILSGVGKRDDEIAAAIAAGLLYICVESEAELAAVARVAADMQARARVSIRVNPDVDAKTHPYIATGLKENKFGVPMAAATALYVRGCQLDAIDMVGVTCHIGSQITTLAPFVDAAERMARLIGELRGAGLPLQHIGMGGGLGVPYRKQDTPPDPAAYGQALAQVLGPLGLRLILEPGRVLVGNAGVLLTRVVRVKQGTDREFVIVDAGMNDLMRPALYGAHHDIEPVATSVALPDHNSTAHEVDVVGPVCESADTFARARVLAPVRAGDVLAIRTAGAYGFAMSSTYNGRPRPIEILCDGERASVIRVRESVADLWRGEQIPAADGAAVDYSALHT